jgi:protein TonB
MSFVVARANVEFKAKYGRYLRYALGVAVVFHIALFAVSPPIRFQPYRLEEQKLEVVELPPDFELPPPPEEVKMPQVNVEAAADDQSEPVLDELPVTTFDDFSEMPSPPPLPPPDTGSDSEVFLAFDEPPVLIAFVEPEYPKAAREAGFEGSVRVRVLVDEQGKVIDADILFSDVYPEMEEAAIKAAMKCRFKPAMQQKTPVRAHVMIPFVFQLK